jgi:hypothetical protein
VELTRKSLASDSASMRMGLKSFVRLNRKVYLMVNELPGYTR